MQHPRLTPGPVDAGLRPALARTARLALLVLLAALAVWALVAVLVNVARQAVRQGFERQRAQALQHEAQWRCRALRGATARQHCLTLVRDRPPVDSAELQALVAQAAAAP